MSRLSRASVAGMSLGWSMACSESSRHRPVPQRGSRRITPRMAPPTPRRRRGRRCSGNLGSHSRAIRDPHTEAQQFFDEGLTLLYGFNHDESFLSFARAAELDDRAPMPHWGKALALGTNINDPAPSDRLAEGLYPLAAAQVATPTAAPPSRP